MGKGRHSKKRNLEKKRQKEERKIQQEAWKSENAKRKRRSSEFCEESSVATFERDTQSQHDSSRALSAKDIESGDDLIDMGAQQDLGLNGLASGSISSRLLVQECAAISGPAVTMQSNGIDCSVPKSSSRIECVVKTDKRKAEALMEDEWIDTDSAEDELCRKQLVGDLSDELSLDQKFTSPDQEPGVAHYTSANMHSEIFGQDEKMADRLQRSRYQKKACLSSSAVDIGKQSKTDLEKELRNTHTQDSGSMMTSSSAPDPTVNRSGATISINATTSPVGNSPIHSQTVLVPWASLISSDLTGSSCTYSVPLNDSPSTDSVAKVERKTITPSETQYSNPDDLAIKFYNRHEKYYEFTNFSGYSVCFEAHHYKTAEHAFQAHKFLNMSLHDAIIKCTSPREALELARRNSKLVRKDWFDVNIEIMENIVYKKFSQHRYLEHLLLETGHRTIVENSGHRDDFWGNGADGRGRNELGKALMKARDQLRRERDYREQYTDHDVASPGKLYEFLKLMIRATCATATRIIVALGMAYVGYRKSIYRKPYQSWLSIIRRLRMWKIYQSWLSVVRGLRIWKSYQSWLNIIRHLQVWR